jgi:hypothetical protein
VAPARIHQVAAPAVDNGAATTNGRAISSLPRNCSAFTTLGVAYFANFVCQQDFVVLSLHINTQGEPDGEETFKFGSTREKTEN